MSLIDARNIDFVHGRQRVLHGVRLSLDPGEIVMIVAPNGSGKSTLLRVLIGALRPPKGTVARQNSLRIGYVTQKLHIDPNLPRTVARFLNLPMSVGRAEDEAALRPAGVPGVGGGQIEAFAAIRVALS